MRLAGIPLIGWVIIAVFVVGAIVGGGTAVAVMWKDCHPPVKQIDEKIGTDGVVQSQADPATCVDWYYKSVLNGNHAQYQFCVMEPYDFDVFTNKVNNLNVTMKRKGRKIVEAPVRGRTEIKDEKNGCKRATVFSISPWSGKEVEYDVISQGQGWRIVKEK